MKKTVLFLSICLCGGSLLAQNSGFESHGTAQGFGGNPKEVAVSSKGNYLSITTGNTQTNLVLYGSGLQEIWRHEGGSMRKAGSAAFSHDEQYMLFSNHRSFSDLALLRISDKKVIQEDKTHQDQIAYIASSPKASFFASAGFDNLICVWELKNGKMLLAEKIKNIKGLVSGLAFSGGGEYLLYTNTSGQVFVYKNENGGFRQIQSLDYYDKTFNSIAVSQDGQAVALAGADGNIRLLDKKGGHFVKTQTLEAGGYALRGLAFSPSGQTLIAAGKTGEVRQWETEYGMFVEKEKIAKIPGEVLSLDFASESGFLAVLGSDMLARVWKTSGIETDQNIEDKNNNSDFLPPMLSIQHIWASESLLRAGGSMKLSVSVKNTGTSAAQNVKLSVTSDLPGLQIPKEIYFDEILPLGGVSTAVCEISANTIFSADGFDLHIKVSQEQFGITLKGQSLRIGTGEKLVSQLVLAQFGVEESASPQPNNQADLNEMLDVKVAIQNMGEQTALGVNTEVANHQKGVMFLGALENGKLSREKTGTGFDIAPGKYVIKTFRFFVNSELQGQKLRFEVSFASKGGERFTQNKEIEINTDLKNQGDIAFIDETDKPGRSTPDEVPDFTVDIWQNIPKARKTNPDAVAVVIGNKNYKHRDVPEVSFAHNDARLMKKYLKEAYGFQENNILYVEDPTQADFNSLFGAKDKPKGKLYNYVKEGVSDVFVFYSGHGAPDPESQEAFFVPSDCDPSLVSLNGYSLNVFYQNLSQIRYKSLTVVVDACFSGMSEGGALLRNVSPIFIKPKNKVLTDEKAMVFSSAMGDQVSSWYPQKKHSLFTYFFLKGIQGSADLNGDGQILLEETKAYLNEQVPYMARRLNNRQQNPDISGNPERAVFSGK